MPYLKPKRRQELEEFYTVESCICINLIEELINEIECAGELNYVITKLCKGYIKKKGQSYANYNEEIGGLECCKLEFYRKEIAPYEDLKEKENGIVE